MPMRSIRLRTSESFSVQIYPPSGRSKSCRSWGQACTCWWPKQPWRIGRKPNSILSPKSLQTQTHCKQTQRLIHISILHLWSFHGCSFHERSDPSALAGRICNNRGLRILCPLEIDPQGNRQTWSLLHHNCQSYSGTHLWAEVLKRFTQSQIIIFTSLEWE